VKVPEGGGVASENALRAGDDELAGCEASVGWLPISSGRVRLPRRLFLREPPKTSIQRRLGIRTACQQAGHWVLRPAIQSGALRRFPQSQNTSIAMR
jgi:hypothetical protein